METSIRGSSHGPQRNRKAERCSLLGSASPEIRHSIGLLESAKSLAQTESLLTGMDAYACLQEEITTSRSAFIQLARQDSHKQDSSRPSLLSRIQHLLTFS